LDAPAGRAVDGLLAGELEIELVDIALFEILETEIGAEEAGGAVLQGDTAVAADRGSPHPLVGGAVRVIDHQQRDASYFRRRHKADEGLVVAIRSDAFESPRLFRDLRIGRHHLDRAFVSLRLRAAPALRLFDDLA